jgi:diguanylate cyclase (GGDEF)-like protein/PAS domain S-box-containing protein
MAVSSRDEGELRDDSLRFVLEASGLGWWDMDLARNATVRSALHDALFGYSEPLPSWAYEDFLAHIHPDDRERVDRAYRGALAGGEEYAEELRVVWPDGTVHWVFTRGRFVLAEDGSPLRVAGVMGDITARKELELVAAEQLAHQATHDQLTGLPNRTNLSEQLRDCLSSDATRREPLAVLFLDLDEFKLVNDAAGHLVGDRMLVEVANRLAASLRDQEAIARFGGDEFVVVCPVAGLPEALEVGQRLHQAVASPVDLSGSLFYPSLSIGVTVQPPGTCPDAELTARAELLVRQADTAMYDAKARGRNRTSVFDEAMAERVRDLVLLTGDLRTALQTGGLQLHYQPVLDLPSGAVLGVEALARWSHPVRGFVSPDVFITAAERSGLITLLDQWVLRRATADAALMRSLGALGPACRMAVNVSAKAVADGLLPRFVREGVLDAEREHLVLEVTETGMMNDPEQARLDLASLHAEGVRVAIDDFGTGQSSLTYLRTFPISVLKVDRSFVQGMATSAEDLAIVRSVVSLALETGLHAVAEGVQTEDQLQLLLEMGCPAGQGYLWTAALPLPAFLEWALSPERRSMAAVPPG